MSCSFWCGGSGRRASWAKHEPGQAMSRRPLLIAAGKIVVLAYPLLAGSSPVYGRMGALVILAAIGASAWNIVGGYAGQVSVGHAVFFGFGAYSAAVAY